MTSFYTTGSSKEVTGSTSTLQVCVCVYNYTIVSSQWISLKFYVVLYQHSWDRSYMLLFELSVITRYFLSVCRRASVMQTWWMKSHCWWRAAALCHSGDATLSTSAPSRSFSPSSLLHSQVHLLPQRVWTTGPVQTWFKIYFLLHFDWPPVIWSHFPIIYAKNNRYCFVNPQTALLSVCLCVRENEWVGGFEWVNALITALQWNQVLSIWNKHLQFIMKLFCDYSDYSTDLRGHQ